MDNVVNCSFGLNSDHIKSNNNKNNMTNSNVCGDLELTINKTPNFLSVLYK